jgi:hypothetical protein
MAPVLADWIKQTGPNEWQVLKTLEYTTSEGVFRIEAGFKCDLFSVVSNTEYQAFWKAAILHDSLSGRSNIPQKIADRLFFEEMIVQAVFIYLDIIDQAEDQIRAGALTPDEAEKIRRETKRKAIKELVKLVARAFVYYRGVRRFGGIYQGLVTLAGYIIAPFKRGRKEKE